MTDTTYARSRRLPGQSSEERWQLAAAALGLLFGTLCLRWSPLLAFEAAAGLAVLLICVVRPFAGVLLTLGLALSMEQYPIISGSAKLMSPTEALGQAFFSNLNTVARLPFLYLNAMELLLIVCALSWLVRGIRTKSLQWRGGALALPLGVMIAAILLAVVRGIMDGAEVRIALWETRAFFQLATAYFLIAHLVNRRSQVRAVVWTILAALLFRAALAVWNAAFVLGFKLDFVEAVTTHEDALFFASLMLLWALLALYRAEPGQRRTLALFMGMLLLALVVSKRRAAMVAFIVAIPYLLALLDWPRLKRAMVAGIPVLILGAAYTGIFWNSSGTVALPVRLLRSVASHDQDARNKASNRFRLLENNILLAGIRNEPFLGMGFGKPYRGSETDLAAREAEANLPELQYEMARYVAHNQILWVWVKAGLVGFVALWFFVTVALSYGTRLAVSLNTPYFRALAATAVLLLGMQMVVSFVDQELTGYRNALYVGVMLGLLARLRPIEREEAEAAAKV